MNGKNCSGILFRERRVLVVTGLQTTHLTPTRRDMAPLGDNLCNRPVLTSKDHENKTERKLVQLFRSEYRENMSCLSQGPNKSQLPQR